MARKLFTSIALFIFSSTLCLAHKAPEWAGTWTLQVEGKTLLVLTLSEPNGKIEGTLDRPAKWRMTNGLFSNMQGQRADIVIAAHEKDGKLYFTTRNALDVKDTDDFVATASTNSLLLEYDGLPPGTLAPFHLARAAAGKKPATDWIAGRNYVPGAAYASNEEMKAIFDVDQSVRQPSVAKINWGTVAKSDAERRARTKQLLDAGDLHTGEDFEWAAFVFQHGDTANDYLLAHTLAMVAVSRGNSTAIWIAAATLDRYLQSIQQPQIFGTQYRQVKGAWTQGPYDKPLVPDTLRQLLAVPTQEMQEQQLKNYAAKK